MPPERRRRRRQARETVRRHVDVPGYALDYVFDEDGFYGRLADQLIDSVPIRRHRKQGHWLCIQLDSAASAISVGAWVAALERETEAALRTAGLPSVIARVLAYGAAAGMKLALHSVATTDTMTALRVLVALVCPDLDVCPVRRPVVKTFATPLLSERLHRAMAPA